MEPKAIKYQLRRALRKWYWGLKLLPTLFFLLVPMLLRRHGTTGTLATLIVQWFSAVILMGQVGSGGVEAITFQHGALSGKAARRVGRLGLLLGVTAGCVVMILLPGGKALLGQGPSQQLWSVLTLMGTGLVMCRTYGHSGAIKRQLGSQMYSTSRDFVFIPVALVMILIVPEQFRIWGLLAAMGQWLFNRHLRSAHGVMPEPKAVEAHSDMPNSGELQREALAGGLLALCGIGFVQLEVIVMGTVLSAQQFMTYNLIIRAMAVISMSTVFVGLETQQLLANQLAALGDAPLGMRSTTSRLFSRLTAPLSLIAVLCLLGLGLWLQQLAFVIAVGFPQLLLKFVNVHSGPTYPALRLNGYSERAAAWLGLELLVLLAALVFLKALGPSWGLIYTCLMLFATIRIATGVWLCRQTFGRMLWI